jgi:hypothetical protein
MIANIMGNIFSIPLEDKGYLLGLIARQHKNIALGYFFNNNYLNIPKNIQECIIDKDNVCLIGLFGILGIKNNKWKIIGKLPDWNINDWPLPPLKQQDPLLNIYYKITYDDTLKEIKRTKINKEEAEKLYSGGIHGYGAIEIILNKTLTKSYKLR